MYFRSAARPAPAAAALTTQEEGELRRQAPPIRLARSFAAPAARMIESPARDGTKRSGVQPRGACSSMNRSERDAPASAVPASAPPVRCCKLRSLCGAHGMRRAGVVCRSRPRASSAWASGVGVAACAARPASGPRGGAVSACRALRRAHGVRGRGLRREDICPAPKLVAWGVSIFVCDCVSRCSLNFAETRSFAGLRWLAC
jgi:hypothetical protein